VSDIKAMHTVSGGIGIDKDCIVSSRAFSPRFHCSYAFTVHATNTGDVAGHMEGGDGRRITCNFAIECWESSVAHIGSRVGMFLVVYKLLDEIGEVRLLDVNGNVFRVNSSYCRCG